MGSPLQVDLYHESNWRSAFEAELSELTFTSFNSDIAFTLGQIIRSIYLSLEASKGILISIRLFNGLILFQSACGPNVTPNNEEWLRRKTNTVREFGLPGLMKGKDMTEKGQDLMSLGPDHAAAGGGFPIMIENVGPIGAILVSGLSQYEDHALIVKAVRTLKSAGTL